MIYFDNAATTKPSKEVLEVFNKVSDTYFANASSIHFLGAKSARLLEQARSKILSYFKCMNHDLVFTSGATEGINLGIKGYCLKYKNRGNHIITTVIEHAAVKEACEWLKQFGFEVTYLPVEEDGTISLEKLKNSITDKTIMVSIMAVNNETGAINDINSMAEYLNKFPKIALLVDATQAIGKVAFDYNLIDMFAFSGHKIHGLKGTGALIKKKNIELSPINSGGGQENGFRSGTSDLPGNASLCKAVEISLRDLKKNEEIVTPLYNKLKEYVSSNPDLFEINSNPDGCKYIFNFSSKTKKASVIVEGLSNKEIMVSSTSACHSKREPISYVIDEMKHNDIYSHNTIRFSFDISNTIEEVDIAIETLKELMKGLKQ